MTNKYQLTLFALLYFVQGSALAYFQNFQKPYLNSFAIDADTIGLLTTILLLPFVLKIFIGILSDRVSLFGMGHRKPYILLGLLLAVATFSAAAFLLPDRSFPLFAATIVLASFSVALFDSTTDGLAIDTTPPEAHGTVQGFMVGGRAAGIILLSLVFGFLVQSHGYRPVFLIIAVSMLLPLVLLFKVDEPRRRPEGQGFQWSAFKALARPRFLAFSLYAILYSVVSFGVDGLVTYYMSQQFNAPETTIGTYGALRGIGAVIGALGGALLVDRLGRRASANGALVLITLGAALLGLATGINAILMLAALWGAAWAFQETIFFALAMDLADSRIAASMFAIMMAVSNLGTAIGEGLATSLTDNLGFSAVFWLLAGLNLLVFPVLWLLFHLAPEVRARTAATRSVQP